MTIHAEGSKSREEQIKFLYNFIKSHRVAVLSTVTGDSLPQSAVVGIGVNENLEVFCTSFTTSRKYENIKKNPRVALVVGWEKGHTVQYEGVAEEVIEEDSDEFLRTHFTNTPSIAKYIPREHGVIYSIKPKWVRFTDLSKDPWERFEINF